MGIKEQIDGLRETFNTKRIIDKTSLASLTEKEVEDIELTIRNNKTDGLYEVDDNISVELKSGTAFIREN